MSSYSDYKIHPIAELFPMLPDEEINKLAEDIKANGQRLSIVRCNGQIVDGRNRLRACLLAGVEPQIKDREDLNTDADVAKAITSMNIRRRHLSASERAAIAVELMTIIEKDEKKVEQNIKPEEAQQTLETNKENQEEPPVEETSAIKAKKDPEEEPAKRNKVKLREEASEMMGVDPSYVARAEKIKTEDPEAFESIKKGEKAISKVQKEKENKQQKTEAQIKEKAHKIVAKCSEVLEKLGYQLVNEEIEKIS